EVGALVGTFDDGTYPYCSGTLVAPTVFLTAAHCDIGQSRVFVTFETTYSASARLYQGSFRADPSYNKSQGDPHDVAVVQLDRSPGLNPARLPTLGALERLPKDQRFTAVGYGGQTPVSGPGGHVIPYPDTRQYAVSTLNAITQVWLKLSQNPAQGNG